MQKFEQVIQQLRYLRAYLENDSAFVKALSSMAGDLETAGAATTARDVFFSYARAHFNRIGLSHTEDKTIVQPLCDSLAEQLRIYEKYLGNPRIHDHPSLDLCDLIKSFKNLADCAELYWRAQSSFPRLHSGEYHSICKQAYDAAWTTDNWLATPMGLILKESHYERIAALQTQARERA